MSRASRDFWRVLGVLVLLGVLIFALASCGGTPAAAVDAGAPEIAAAADTKSETTAPGLPGDAGPEVASDASDADADSCPIIGTCILGGLCAPHTFEVTPCPSSPGEAICTFHENTENGSHLQEWNCSPSTGVECVQRCSSDGGGQ